MKTSDFYFDLPDKLIAQVPILDRSSSKLMVLDKETGEIILCDEFSPDTCRLWDKDGKSFDKDVFRKGLGNVEETYKNILDMIQGK